ncbi:MAG: glycosyltransferase [Rhodobacter sp.]|nr:glycosyltransferase [Rhodobacter sp.]
MSEGRHRLLLLINSLEGGGAEKVMAYLAGELAKTLNGVDIRLALLDDLPAAYAVDSAVEVVRLDSRGSLLRSISQTRRQIAAWQPDVVLSFLTRANCAAILARRKGHFRCVISERVNTSSHFGNQFRGRLFRRIVSRLYPRADKIVAVSEGVRDEMLANYQVPAARLSVIHNPFDIARLRTEGARKPTIALPDDFFVTAGRLVPNKGHEVLLHAFARHRNRDRALLVLGEGAERPALETLARDLGIADRVQLPGYVENPHAIISRATAYVSASRSEGFPNALVEAMALGCAVAATDCPSGPAEILAERPAGMTDGLETAAWGLLVPMDDAAGLSTAMDYYDDPGNRQRYAKRAGQRSAAFAPAPVVAAYAQALGSQLDGRHGEGAGSLLQKNVAR